MIYRDFGRTGHKVSQLGFGAMRLPMEGEGDERRIDRDKAIPMIHRAFEGGLNYIDTAVFYCNQDSQRVVGEALKGWRDRVIVSTKNHFYEQTEAEWWQNLENSLERLDIDCIDVYNTHGVSWKNYCEHVEPRVSKYLQKAKDQGLIRHICTSFHDSPEALHKIVDTGFYEAVTLQYNMLDRSLEEGIAHAHEAGMAVIAMGPIGGGNLAGDSEVLQGLVPGVERVPELALRFVLANPHVTLALSGMSTMQHVEENLAVAAEQVALTDDDKDAIDEHLTRLRKMADLYCTGCRYCLPCPESVAIPRIFAAYNRGRVYGLWDQARRAYNRIDGEKQKDARACIECGQCESKCPQNIPIVRQLKEVHKRLAATP